MTIEYLDKVLNSNQNIENVKSLPVGEEKRRKNSCQNCNGWGEAQDGGMFSQFYKCDVCKGTGKKKK